MRFNVCYRANPLIALRAVPVRCDQACLLGSIDWDICVTANKRLLLIFLTAVHFRPCFEGWGLNYLRCLFSASARRPPQALLAFHESRTCSGAWREDKAGSSRCLLIIPVTLRARHAWKYFWKFGTQFFEYLQKIESIWFSQPLSQCARALVIKCSTSSGRDSDFVVYVCLIPVVSNSEIEMLGLRLGSPHILS